MTELLAIVLAALAGAATPAAEVERAAPVQVDADEVHYAFQKREVTFTGKGANPVTLTREDARLSCRKLVARTDEAGQIVTATCAGDVRFTRGTRVVTCERATFEAAAEQVVCEGDPVLRDGGAVVRATRIVYDLRGDEARAEGAKMTLPGEEVEQRRRELAERRRKEGKP